jgi:hypothetical protein
MKRIWGVLWRGKVMLLALMVALALGAASTAMGHTGSVGLFHLNHSNTGTALTTLAANLASPVVRFDNNGTGPAMNLQVEPGRAPMTVNSAAGTATNLSADELDGQDSTNFLPRSTYTKEESTFGTDLGGGNRLWEVFCDSGDKILGGGYFNVDATGTTVRASGVEDFHQGWYMEWTNNDGTADEITVQAYCADL